MDVFNNIRQLAFSSNLTPVALLVVMGAMGLSVANIAYAGVTNANPAPFTGENTSTLCYVFPSAGGTATKQVPCSYTTTEPTYQKLADYKKKCRDKDTDSADLMKQSTSIQFTGYGVYEHIASDFVWSGQGDGWVIKDKDIKTFNKKPAIIKYRHVATGKVIPQKTYSKAWEDYYASNKTKSKPSYVECVGVKGTAVDLCVPTGSVPNFSFRE